MDTKREEPAHHSGELLRFLADPTVAEARARAGLIMLFVIPPSFLTWALMIPFPYRAVVLTIGLAVTVGCLVDYRRTRTQRRERSVGDGPIELLLIPEGFMTRGGLEVPWHEVAAVNVEGLYREGTGIRVTVRLDLKPDTGTRERAINGLQRAAFSSKGKRVDAELGWLGKKQRKRTLAVLQERCERVGVPYTYEQRKAPTSGGSSVDPVN